MKKRTREEIIDLMAEAITYYRENCPAVPTRKFLEEVAIKFSLTSKVMRTLVQMDAGAINATQPEYQLDELRELR